MARRERRALARGAAARLEARVAQGRPPARADRRAELSVGRIQGEGRLDGDARLPRGGAGLRGHRAQQVEYPSFAFGAAIKPTNIRKICGDCYCSCGEKLA